MVDPKSVIADERNGVDVEDFQENNSVRRHDNREDDDQSLERRWSRGSDARSGSGFDGNSFKGSFTQENIIAEEEDEEEDEGDEVEEDGTSRTEDQDRIAGTVHRRARSMSDLDTGDTHRRSSSKTMGNIPAPLIGEVNTSEKKDTRSNVSLDPDEPGAWLIDHHNRNIITKLRKYGEKPPPKPEPPKSTRTKKKVSFLSEFPSSIWKWVSRGGGEAKPPPSDEEAGQKEAIFIEGESEKSVPAEGQSRFRVSFAEMQRMKMRKLQVKLVKNAVDMCETGEEPEDWEENLSKFVEAMKDYDYMNTCSLRLQDPFLVSGEHFVDYWVIKRALSSAHDRAAFLARDFTITSSLAPWNGPEDANPIGGTRRETARTAKLRAFGKRVTIAACGGAFLVGPMWLMVLHHTRYTALVSTTVCVVAFGLFMAFLLPKEIDVLSSTAAYAAVLVVFVGLNT